MSLNVYYYLDDGSQRNIGKIAEGVIAKGKKILLVCNEDEIQPLDQLLWQYAQLSFLPHATKFDPYQDKQELYITDDIKDNPIAATVLMCMELPKDADLSAFERVVLVRSQANLQADNDNPIFAGHEANRFLQSTDGRWGRL
jgi:DNA polymerase-3 subunit chi